MCQLLEAVWINSRGIIVWNMPPAFSFRRRENLDEVLVMQGIMAYQKSQFLEFVNIHLANVTEAKILRWKMVLANQNVITGILWEKKGEHQPEGMWKLKWEVGKRFEDAGILTLSMEKGAKSQEMQWSWEGNKARIISQRSESEEALAHPLVSLRTSQV